MVRAALVAAFIGTAALTAIATAAPGTSDPAAAERGAFDKA
jgi:hypothetical protein